MSKKILSFFVIAAVLISAMSLCVAAENEIANISLEISEPRTGAAPSFSAKANDSGYTVSSVEWYDITETKSNTNKLSSVDSFMPDSYYRVRITVGCSAGNSFSSDAAASVNGMNASCLLPDSDNSETERIITYDFGKTKSEEKKQIIQNIAVSVTAPREGEHPTDNATVSTKGCSVSSVSWYDDSTGNKAMGRNEKFAIDRQYKVNLVIKVDSEYELSSAFSVTVNDGKGKVIEKNIANQQSITVSYRFDTVIPANSKTEETDQSADTVESTEHKHSFEQAFDSVNHWQECDCGKKNSVELHRFKDGVCIVCGYKKGEEVTPAGDVESNGGLPKGVSATLLIIAIAVLLAGVSAVYIYFNGKPLNFRKKSSTDIFSNSDDE